MDGVDKRPESDGRRRPLTLGHPDHPDHRARRSFGFRLSRTETSRRQTVKEGRAGKRVRGWNRPTTRPGLAVKRRPPAASAPPVRSPRLPFTVSASVRRGSGCDTKAPNGIGAWMQPTGRRPGTLAQRGPDAGRSSHPDRCQHTNYTHPLDIAFGRRCRLSVLSLAPALRGIRQLKPAPISEPPASQPTARALASTTARIAGPSAPHQTLRRCRRRDVRESAISQQSPSAHRRCRATGVTGAKRTLRRRGLGPRVEPCNCSASPGAPRTGGTTPLQGTGQLGSGTEGGPALASASAMAVKRVERFWLLGLSGAGTAA